MKNSMTGQEKGELLIQMTAYKGGCNDWFDCNLLLNWIILDSEKKVLHNINCTTKCRALIVTSKWHEILQLTLWVRIPLRQGVLDTTLCDKVCQCLATGRWFSPGTPVYSTNKTDCHDITEILLKVVLNTITPSRHEILQKLIKSKLYYSDAIFAASTRCLCCSFSYPLRSWSQNIKLNTECGPILKNDGPQPL